MVSKVIPRILRVTSHTLHAAEADAFPDEGELPESIYSTSFGEVGIGA